MRLYLMVAGTLFLSACGSGDVSNTAGNAQAAAAASDLPRPGLYRVTETSQVVGDTGAVPGPPETHQTCYSEHPEKAFLSLTGMNCTGEDVSMRHGTIDVTMHCTTPGTAVQDSPYELRGSYDKNSAEGTADVILQQGMVRLTTKLERIGDC